MFCYNENRTKLINLDFVRLVRIERPLGEEGHMVIADLDYGTEILFRGTKTACEAKIEQLGMMINGVHA